jgi:hypothetical protein
VTGVAVNVSSLYQDTRYPVLRAELVEPKYVQRVQVTLREEMGILLKSFYRQDKVTSSRMRTYLL